MERMKIIQQIPEFMPAHPKPPKNITVHPHILCGFFAQLKYTQPAGWCEVTSFIFGVKIRACHSFKTKWQIRTFCLPSLGAFRYFTLSLLTTFWNPDIFQSTVKACVSASLHLTVSFFVWLFSRNVENGTRTRWLNAGEVPVYCFGCKSQYVGTWAAWRRTVLSECSSHQWMKHLHCSDTYWWDTRGKKVRYLGIMNPRML